VCNLAFGSVAKQDTKRAILQHWYGDRQLNCMFGGKLEQTAVGSEHTRGVALGGADVQCLGEGTDPALETSRVSADVTILHALSLACA
jgi:hypothetical protein